MPLYALPPLDIQTESLSREQQPSPRTLLVVALIAVVGMGLSFLAQRAPAEAARFPEGPHGPGGAVVVMAAHGR